MLSKSGGRRYNEDAELWGHTGLLHDFDYERNPEPPDHPTVGMRVLREQGWPEAMIHAIGDAAVRTSLVRLRSTVGRTCHGSGREHSRAEECSTT